MKFEKIYIQDNFVPDIVTDQFRRMNIGVGMIVEEGDNLADVVTTAKTFIAEFIKEHTVTPEHKHIEERTVQVLEQKSTPKESMEQRIINDLNTCTEVKVLESYWMLAKSNPTIKQAYDLKMQSLTKK